jgi:hypothetical protein
MNTHSKIAAAFLVAASSLIAQAADAPAPAVSFGGYAVATADYTKTSGVGSTTTADLDAAKFGVTGKFGTVTGYASLFYDGGATNVLDAYFTVDAGSGLTVTVGKFLSYMGYEAFDIPNMAQISYANGALLGFPVPGYHTGAKLDYATATYGAGLAVVDSVYGSDEDLKKPGLEAYFTYKGIKDTTVWFGIADEVATSTVVYDLWVSYALNKTDSIGAEYLIKESAGNNWLVAYTKDLGGKWTLTSRVSGESVTGGADMLKYTVSPSYSVNDHFIVRGELSYTDNSAGTPSQTFLAVQSIFKF